jgi:hypothetical protein
MQQRAARLVIVTFAVLLSMPLAATIARIGTETPSAESSRAGDRQHGFFGWLDYFDTHFGFRQQLVHAHAFTSIRTMNISPSPAVIKGRDGWLYYADDDALEDYESATPMSEAELRGWANTLVSTRDVLRAHGIAYLFVLAPDKHVIYPEHLPESIHRVRPTYRMDELLAYLRQHTDLSVLDLRPALIARKQVEQVYFRTDTHWNDAGAFAGYQDILRAASRAVGSLSPQDRSNFTPVERDEPGGDLAEMLGVPDLLRERSTYLEPRVPRRARLLEPPTLREGYEVARVVTEVPDSKLPRLVMFRDSFATRLIPLLSEHFSRAVYQWQTDVDLDLVAQEKPALVIHEMVGRRLLSYAP